MDIKPSLHPYRDKDVAVDVISHPALSVYVQRLILYP